MPVADVSRIVQQTFAVGADIEHDRNYTRRVDSTRGRMNGQFADGDLDRAHTPIADSQNLLTVGRDDQVDFTWAMLPNACSMASAWSIER